MGYNNNNAGMHFIRYNRYAQYEDLAYYDKLAEKRKMEKGINTPAVNSSNKPVTTDKNSKNKISERKAIIDISHIVVMNVATRNILIYALQKKKDIYKIVSDADQLMLRDGRTSPEESEDIGRWQFVPALEKVTIFLSIISSKLECSLSDLFKDDEKLCKRVIYHLLEDISGDCDYIGPSDGEVDEKGNASIYFSSFDGYFLDFPNDDKFNSYYKRSYSQRMELTFCRDRDEDGFYYSVSYGTVGPLNLQYEFFNAPKRNKHLSQFESRMMLLDSCLYEEKRGALQKFVDRLIEKHPEWGSV